MIDWGCHDNNTEFVISEVLDFDKAVKEALDFAKKDKNTLVVITADHETGGLSLGNNSKNGFNLGLFQNQKISAQEFERLLKNLKEEKRKISFEEVLGLIQTNFGLGDASKGLELTKAEKNGYMMLMRMNLSNEEK